MQRLVVGAARRLNEEKGGRSQHQIQTQEQIQEQAKRRPPSTGVVRALHQLISWLQSTLLGLAAGVAFKLCPFGGEHPFIGWLGWAVGFHQHRPAPSRFGPSGQTRRCQRPLPCLCWPCREILSCSLDCDIAPLHESGELVGHGPFLKLKTNVCSLHPVMSTHTRPCGQERLLTLGSPLPEIGTALRTHSVALIPRVPSSRSGQQTLLPCHRPERSHRGTCKWPWNSRRMMDCGSAALTLVASTMVARQKLNIGGREACLYSPNEKTMRAIHISSANLRPACPLALRR